VKDSEGLLVKDQEVVLTLPEDLEGEFDMRVNARNGGKTNEQGKAVFKIEGTAKEDSKPNTGDLIFTVNQGEDKEPLQTTAELSIIGALPKPEPEVKQKDKPKPEDDKKPNSEKDKKG